MSLTAITTMWHWRNSAFYFELKQVFLFGSIFSLEANSTPELHSGFTYNLA
jgi:hypothetical protein